MAFKATKEQQMAIRAKGATLVSAAAGSGKTAVLVQRVVQLLGDSENPLPADRLLIVTFTNAAAAEMKSRIEKALGELAAKFPDNAYLQHQLLLLPLADICTIDSFCMKLVRNYFSLLAVPPDFKIADEGVQNAIANAALADVFEKHYQAQDEGFLCFLQAADSAYGDCNAMDIIRELHSFCLSLPFAEKWLNDSIMQQSQPLLESDYAKNQFNAFASRLKTVQDNTAEICRTVEGDAKLSSAYAEALISLQRCLADMADAAKNGLWDRLYEQLLQNTAVPAKRNFTKCDLQVKAQLWQFMDETRAFFKEWSAVFYDTAAEIDRANALSVEMSRTAATLYREFDAAYFEALKEKGYLTFAYCERLVLQLLCRLGEEGQLLLTDQARDIAALYSEVMVDEFQDVNNLQDTIFQILSDNGSHLFAVGDVKQSIYGFRLSNPANFIRRINTAVNYREDIDPSKTKIINLNSNFRSRAGVCNFINAFFSQMMCKEVGAVDYRKQEYLNAAASYPENGRLCCEIHTVTYNGKDMEHALAVAEQLANTIEQLMERQPFLKETDSTLRRADYADIALLLRSRKHVFAIVQALKNRGIPASVNEGALLEEPEISLLLSFLKVISNPTDNVALLAVLLSPLFGFTAEQVAQLRLDHGQGRLYKLLLLHQKEQPFAAVLQRLEHFRRRAAGLSVGALVGELIHDGGFANLAAASTDGSFDDSNLIYFQSIANSFSKESGNDLSAFLVYLEHAAAGKGFSVVGGTEQNSVTIMTMHQSKGLQYPICIVADCMHRFNATDRARSYIFDQNTGIAFQAIDTRRQIKVKSLYKKQMEQTVKKEQLSEEMRLLYVAMTRAEELLIFQLCGQDITKKKEQASLKAAQCRTGGSTVNLRTAVTSMGDWLLLFTALHKGENCFEEKQFSVENIKEARPEETAFVPPDPAYLDALSQAFDFEYPFTALRHIEVKTSVSALTKQQAARDYCASSRPAFLSEGGLTPTERGTAFHKFMQFANFSAARQDISGEIERLYELEYLTRAEADSIRPVRVEQFFQSTLFKRLSASDTVLREKRFMLEIPAGEFDPALSGRLAALPVMVQGAIDCMFFEPDGIVVLDFKTDRIREAEVLLAHYHEQLQIYCRAVEKMYQKPVKDCYLYALYTGQQIKVPLLPKK